MPKKCADIGMKYGAIIIAPLFILVFSEALFRHWSASFSWEKAISGKPGGFSCQLAEAASRLDVLSSLLAVGVFSILVFFFFVRETLLYFEGRALKKVVLFYTICLVIGGVFVVGDWLVDSPWRVWETYGTKIIEALGTRVPKSKLDEQQVFLERVMNLANAGLVVAICATVVGAICCSFSPPSNMIDEQAATWRSQLRRAQIWLYLAAGLLILGLIFHHAWGRWLGSCLPKEEYAAYGVLVSSFTGYKGIEFTVFLASFYLPILMLLSRQADGIAEVSDNNSTLEIPFADMAKVIAAILAPFLAGLIGPAGDALKGLVKL